MSLGKRAIRSSSQQPEMQLLTIKHAAGCGCSARPPHAQSALMAPRPRLIPFGGKGQVSAAAAHAAEIHIHMYVYVYICKYTYVVYIHTNMRIYIYIIWLMTLKSPRFFTVGLLDPSPANPTKLSKMLPA